MGEWREKEVAFTWLEVLWGTRVGRNGRVAYVGLFRGYLASFFFYAREHGEQLVSQSN